MIAKIFTFLWDAAKAPFEAIWGFIQKVVEAWGKVKSFFSGKEKKVDVEANVAGGGQGNVNSTNNNTNVTVHTSGQLNESSAARIGEGFAMGVTRNNMMS